MALAINNRVRETTATTGTGAVTLAGAVDGFQTFAAGIGNSNTTYYAISLNTSNEWEVGLGTLNGDSSTLTRTSVLESSNGDAAVDFSAGSKEIFCTLPSEKAVYLDASGDPVGAIASLVEDTSPQLGGDLDLNSNNLDFPTVTNISDCLDEDDMSSDSATKLATQQSIKAYVDATSGGAVTTAGETFENYNEISSSVDTTLVATKNYFIMGEIDVTGSAVWDVKGSGVLNIL